MLAVRQPIVTFTETSIVTEEVGTVNADLERIIVGFTYVWHAVRHYASHAQMNLRNNRDNWILQFDINKRYRSPQMQSKNVKKVFIEGFKEPMPIDPLPDVLLTDLRGDGDNKLIFYDRALRSLIVYRNVHR